MAASNQIPEGIIATVDDGRDVIDSQSVRASLARLAVRLKVRTVLADTMRGINHSLALCWSNIIADGTTDACATARCSFSDGGRISVSPHAVSFFVIVGILGDLFQTMFFDVGAVCLWRFMPCFSLL